MNRIEQVRKNIDNGRYDSDEVIDATVENLRDAMRRVAGRRGDSILTDDWPDMPPVVMGGQGRTDDEAYSDGKAIAWIALFAAVAALGVAVYVAFRAYG